MYVSLRIPTLEDMPFRAALMADEATMAYNAPYAPPSGVLPFAEEAWQPWLDRWTGHAPERWYAIVCCDEEPVGEACWHNGGQAMGVMIRADKRRAGIGAAALGMLIDEAFRHAEITELKNTFEPDRQDALNIHLRAGFAPIGMQDGCLVLRLTREAYEARRRRSWLMDVYDAMAAYDAGNPHQIHHNAKVHSFARQIGLREGLDDNTQFVLEVAAMTHDIGIKPAVEQTGACPGPLQEQLGPPIAEVMLTELGLPAPVIRRVCFLIGHHHTTQQVAGIDWRILLEADFLVNMIEGRSTQAGIDAVKENVFRTAEGLRLIEQIRPAAEE